MKKTQDRRDLSSPRRADLFPISFTLGYVVALLVDQPWAATNAIALPLWALCTVMLGLIWLRHFKVTLKARQLVAAGAALVLAAWLAPSCKHSHDTEKPSGNDDPTIITELPPDTVFYLNDHLGSPVVELDARGNVIRERSYHPYGSVRRSRGRAGDPWSYVGNEYDTGSRLAHFHARQLRPRMGGFYSPDPVAVFHPELGLGAPHRLAPYTYSGGDPINLRDPNGETPVGALIAGAAVFIGVVTVTSFANAPGPETETHNRLSLGGFISAAAHNSWVAYGALRSFPLSAAVLYAEATQEPRQPTDDPFVEQVRQLSPPGRTFGGPCPPGAFCSGGGQRTYQTYTKTNQRTGEVYSGRTSGMGKPKDNVRARDGGHHMTKKGFGAAKLDKSSTNEEAIRGREQQLIDVNGGAKSNGGTSGNAINGISPSNPKRQKYLNEAKKEF